MNVIVANKYKDALSDLPIDVIKRMDGEFDVSTITDTFANFYFNRMILDITAIKDPFNIANIQKLCANLDASKIILFLSDDPRINNSYLSKIISLGIYNFTKELTGLTYLMDNPNSYRDVQEYHNLAANDEKQLAAARNNPGYQNNNMNMNNSYQSEPSNQSTLENGFSFGMQDNSNNGSMGYGPSSTRIIGFKDLTDDAGSTSLIYMLKKQMKMDKVLAVEIDSNDFSYFNDSELMSVTSANIGNVKNKFSQFDIVLIDLNKSNLDKDGTCTEVLYLLEPSTIKLNTLLRTDRGALEKIKNNKIVLNKSLLSQSDVKEFEYEAKASIFYNIPPLDERKDHQMVLDSFLEKLGVYTGSNNGGGSIFDIFKR